MGNTSIDATTEAMTDHIAGFQPAGREDLSGFLTGVAELPRALGAAIAAARDNLSQEHVHQSVLDALDELSSVISGVGDTADQVVSAHTSGHDVWLD